MSRQERWIIANHNLHSIYLYHHDQKMREFYSRAKILHIDGMPLIFLGWALGLPFKRAHRVGYIDWIGPLMDEASRGGWRVFFLGSRPGVGTKAATILKRGRPGLDIATSDGYFCSSPGSHESEEVVQRINSYRPHILIVGMGMPKQEHWVSDNIERLRVNVVLNGGACMDFVAGEKLVPPRWLGSLGLEWLYRLVTEPTRLWCRYLIEPWYLFGLVVRSWLAKRKPERDGAD